MNDKALSIEEAEILMSGWRDLRFEARAQGFDAIHLHHYETALCNPDILEVWLYTDRLSYRAGDEVRFHVTTTARQFSLDIYRDGRRPTPSHSAEAIAGESAPLPAQFYAKGCGWPVAYRWRIPEAAQSGFYVVRVRAVDKAGTVREHEHGFFVRPQVGTRKSDILFIGSTATWLNYNDWGGANNYLSVDKIEGHHLGSPRLTVHRPLGRGFAWLPEGAPRVVHEERPPLNWAPRYPCFEYAYAMGFSKFYSCAGWAAHERHMTVWAEANGFRFDYACQHDLHAEPDLLDGYRCVVMVGHCEYWSTEMRDAIDRFVERGGNAARFAGNMAGKVRYEDDMATQVCYKMYPDRDPKAVAGDNQAVAGGWGDMYNNRPAVSTFGLDSKYGILARFGAFVPRGAGGFTVYRPDHWAFTGTDLYYGDNFGDEARILAFECDGLDYVIRDGLPVPVERPGLPKDIKIIAMGLSCNHEAGHGHRATNLFYGNDGIASWLAPLRYGDNSADRLEAAKYGSSMIVSFTRGKGEVFHAGTCDWVFGLKYRDEFTEAITRNVLEKFTR
jgi:N,N-dimethylformamidase beta subunit-like, C-terminal